MGQPLEPFLRSVRHDSLSDLAYRAVRSAVVDGRIPAGTQLVESRLAAELGISRGPLREALTRLTKEGLLEQKPRRGTFVRQLTGMDLVGLYNFRLAIETTALRLGLRRGMAFSQLASYVVDMRDGASTGELGAVDEAEFFFHERICELSNNRYILEAFRNLNAQLRMAFHLDNQGFANLADIADEHAVLLEVLETGQEAAAVAALGDHIRSTIGVLLGRMNVSPSELLPDLMEPPNS